MMVTYLSQGLPVPQNTEVQEFVFHQKCHRQHVISIWITFLELLALALLSLVLVIVRQCDTVTELVGPQY